MTVTAVSGALCLQNPGGAPFFSNGYAATSAHSVYFSFVTLTTVGYGDFTARTTLGHTLSVTVRHEVARIESERIIGPRAATGGIWPGVRELLFVRRLATPADSQTDRAAPKIEWL